MPTRPLCVCFSSLLPWTNGLGEITFIKQRNHIKNVPAYIYGQNIAGISTKSALSFVGQQMMDELHFSGWWECHFWFRSFTLEYDVTNDGLFLLTCNVKTIECIKGSHRIKKMPLTLPHNCTKAKTDLHVKYESIHSY